LAGHLAKYFDKVIGVDISDSQLKAASETYKTLDNVSFQNANMDNLQ